MNTYFMCPLSTLEIYKAMLYRGVAYTDVHWLHTLADGSPLPNDMALVVIVDGKQEHVAAFAALDGAVQLPGLMSQATIANPLQSIHAEAMMALGVADAAQETTASLATKAAAIHPAFMPVGF